MPQPWTSLRTLRLEPWSPLLSSTCLVSSCESSAASCLILFATQSSSFYLLSYDASTKSPGAGQSSNNALGGPNSPKARSSSPSPLSLILLSLSLHFPLFKPSPLFTLPDRPRSPSCGACCVCDCQGGTGPTAAQPRLSTGLAPAHNPSSSPPTGQLSLCTPPPAELQKHTPACQNPSQSIPVHPGSLQLNVIQHIAENPAHTKPWGTSLQAVKLGSLNPSKL